MASRLIALDERGRPIGEDHHAAKLSNREVQMLRAMRDTDPVTWTFPRLAEKFEISLCHAKRLYHYQRRAQIPSDFRREATAARG